MSGAPIVMRAGDLLVLERDRDEMRKRHPSSWLVTVGTGSPFSHIAIVLEDGRLAQSMSGQHMGLTKSDVQLLTYDELRAKIADKFTLHLLRAVAPRLDARLLTQYAERTRIRAERHEEPRPDQVQFTMAPTLMLAALQLWQRSPFRDVGHVGEALVYALDDGDRWMFCSEFVYRALQAAGQPFRLQKRPNIDLPGIDATEVTLERGLATLEEKLARLKADVGWTATDDAALAVLWERFATALEGGLRVEHPCGANFASPVDLAYSPDFCRIATRTREQDTWHSADPFTT